MKERELIKELQEKLEWYTLHATEEEYDEKAVESILYLLDMLTPIADEDIPDVNAAWQQFELRKEGAEHQKLAGMVEGKKMRIRQHKGGKTIVNSILRNKGIVAAVLIILILALAGSIPSEAVRDGGFFHWLKSDEKGKQMVTSPENLSGNTEVKSATTYYDKENMPEWTAEWRKTVEELALPEGYVWQQYEVKEFSHSKSITSQFTWNGKNMIVGILYYSEQVSFNTEFFNEYRFVEKIELEGKWAELYEKIAENGKVYNRIILGEENYFYFLQGEESIEKLQELMVQYMELMNPEIKNKE